MLTTQRDSISSPAIGLLVFDTNKGQFYVYNGSAWVTSDSNWLGSTTRIKLLPKDFVGTLKDDKKGDKTAVSVYADFGADTSTDFGMSTSGEDLVAFIALPMGYEATAIDLFGNESTADYYVFVGDIENADDLTTAYASSTVGASKITFGTAVGATTTNYLVVAVKFPKAAEDILYGGYVAIEPD